jgi:hypothetical protein
MTIQNLGTKTEVLNFLPNDVVTATVTASTAIDLVDYEGDIAVVLCAEAGSAGVTYLGKLTESDTSGGTYTDVTGGAFTITTANTASVQKISVNSERHEAVHQGSGNGCRRYWYRRCGDRWPGLEEVQLMAFTEDLSIFLADFGVSCTAGAVTALGILDMPGQVISDGMVLTTDYTLTAKASDFGSLIRNDAITVDAVAYTVREALLLDDGKIVQIALQKT